MDSTIVVVPIVLGGLALLGLCQALSVWLVWRRVRAVECVQVDAARRAAASGEAALTAAHGHDARLTALERVQGEDALRWAVTTPLLSELQTRLWEHAHDEVADLTRTVAALDAFEQESRELRRVEGARLETRIETLAGIAADGDDRLEALLAAQEAAWAAAVAQAAPADHTHPHTHELSWPEHTHPTNEHWHTEGQALETLAGGLERRLAALEQRPFTVMVPASGTVGGLAPVLGSASGGAAGDELAVATVVATATAVHPDDHVAEYYQVGGTWEHGQLHVTERCRLCGHLQRHVATPPLLE